jgi:hypothetical protein
LHEKIGLLESRIARQQFEPAAQGEGPDLSTLTYGINDHLKDRQAIQKKLRELNVLGSTSFGDDVDEPPNGRNVAIRLKLSQEYIRSILDLATDLGFDTYSFISPNESIHEDVLFGSYGEPDFAINR